MANDPLLSSTSVSANAAETKACPGTVDQMGLEGWDWWEIERDPPLSVLQSTWKSFPTMKVWSEGTVWGLKKRLPRRRGREEGVDGKGLFRCLWCFLEILRAAMLRCWEAQIWNSIYRFTSIKLLFCYTWIFQKFLLNCFFLERRRGEHRRSKNLHWSLIKIQEASFFDFCSWARQLGLGTTTCHFVTM